MAGKETPNKILLEESEMPTQWYDIVADLPTRQPRYWETYPTSRWYRCASGRGLAARIGSENENEVAGAVG